MEIVVTARHTQVPDRFRRHLEEKLGKVQQLAPRAQRTDVKITHEVNRRQADQCERIELTVQARGTVVRAEACADDLYGALDLAHGKLLERLRRVRDRSKVHHGRRTPKAVREATSDLPLPDAALDGAGQDADQDDDLVTVHEDGTTERLLDSIGNAPVVIREKTHAATPMSLDDALYEMELVGHDFYLFIDSDSGRPSVVYRRRGWDYGVIRLDDEHGEAGADPLSEAGAATG